MLKISKGGGVFKDVVRPIYSFPHYVHSLKYDIHPRADRFKRTSFYLNKLHIVVSN